MATFIIADKHNGTLVPIQSVVQQLPLAVVERWCFREIRIHLGRPFGLVAQEFERLTRTRPDGYCVSDCNMRLFLDSGIQIVDGEIDAFAMDGTLLFTIVCEDLAQWEITTVVPELSVEMEKKGFLKRRSEDSFPPSRR